MNHLNLFICCGGQVFLVARVTLVGLACLWCCQSTLSTIFLCCCSAVLHGSGAKPRSRHILHSVHR